MITNLLVQIAELKQEVERLKAGRFTEEEFQNLCHTLGVQDGRCRFEKGCEDYQKKLFGEKGYEG